MPPTLLDLFPARVAIGSYTDANGRRVPVLASQEFLRALQQVLDRLGGAVGPSITDLSIADDEDSGIEELRHESSKALDALAMVPVQEFSAPDDPMHPLVQQHSEVQALQTELNGLREEVAVLRQLINDIQQGTML